MGEAAARRGRAEGEGEVGARLLLLYCLRWEARGCCISARHGAEQWLPDKEPSTSRTTTGLLWCPSNLFLPLQVYLHAELDCCSDLVVFGILVLAFSSRQYQR